MKDLAVKAGVSESTIRRYETGLKDPSAQIITALAAALVVSPERYAKAVLGQKGAA